MDRDNIILTLLAPEASLKNALHSLKRHDAMVIKILTVPTHG